VRDAGWDGAVTDKCKCNVVSHCHPSVTRPLWRKAFCRQAGEHVLASDRLGTKFLPHVRHWTACRAWRGRGCRAL
jgi:hypothetical protein